MDATKGCKEAVLRKWAGYHHRTEQVQAQAVCILLVVVVEVEVSKVSPRVRLELFLKLSLGVYVTGLMRAKGMLPYGDEWVI
jgi:hypothetical protein